MTDLELIRIQAETLFRLDANGRIVATNEPVGSRPGPTAFLGRTVEGNHWRLGHDAPSELTAILAAEPIAADLAEAPFSLSRLRELFGPDAVAITRGPAFVVPELPPANAAELTDPGVLRGPFAWLADELADWSPAAAVIVEGTAVSICFSSRLGTRAAEAGLETLEAHRGRGHASTAVATWAALVRRRGLLPLYSTSWGNEASRGVARRLGLRLYGEDISFTVRG